SMPSSLPASLLEQVQANRSAEVDPTKGPSASKPAGEMAELASEFESVFLSMLLKELRQSLDDGFFGGESSDSMGGMFDMFIGKHLADASPLGIGNLVTGQLSPTSDVSKYQKRSDVTAEGEPSLSVQA
ncbi:MAG: hypothetical protein AAGJ83_16460, partial [Planctomycetota bacterium]